MTDITRYRGDTYADEFAIKNSSGVAVNITGYTFKLSVDSLENPTDALTQVYQLTGTITDAANGLVEFPPSAVQSDLSGRYYYDVEMTDGAGRITTIKKGAYIFEQDISK